MHHCASCGAEMPPQDASCSKCGARNERRVRYSLWRVGILTFLTFGLYYYYWMYVSWKHLAEEVPGKEFHPFWHAMSQFAPIYNSVVIYQHFRTIKDVQERERVKSNLVPGLALALSIVLPYILTIGVWILVFVLLWALLSFSVAPAVAVLWVVISILMLIAAVAGTFLTLVLWGQRNLNKYWERPGARPVRSARTGPGEIIISAAGGLFTALIIMGGIWLVVSSQPTSIDIGSERRGTIESHTQVDNYRLTVRAGTRYTIRVSPTTLGLGGDPLEAAIVALWDSDGSLRTRNADTPIEIPWTASSSGTRYVTIESDGTDLGNYALEILEVTATSSVSEADSFAPIQTSVGYQGTILSHLQVDSYGLPVQEGAGYAIYVVSRTTLRLDGDPLEAAIVTLWDSDGATILRTINADTPIVIPWTASSSGTMYVTIESDGTDLGDYVLRVDAQ